MSNFSVLSQHDEQLLRLGMLAEKYFADDPNTCLLKLRCCVLSRTACRNSCVKICADIHGQKSVKSAAALGKR